MLFFFVLLSCCLAVQNLFSILSKLFCLFPWSPTLFCPVLSTSQQSWQLRHIPVPISLFAQVSFSLIFVAGCLLRNPRLNKLAAQAFCVTEAKGPDQRLESHIPQALAELYACAKHQEWASSFITSHHSKKSFRKRIIRGALTNGHEWIFFILKLDEGGNGGKYSQSTVINLMRGESEVSHEGSSLIAAIIADWVRIYWHALAHCWMICFRSSIAMMRLEMMISLWCYSLWHYLEIAFNAAQISPLGRWWCVFSLSLLSYSLLIASRSVLVLCKLYWVAMKNQWVVTNQCSAIFGARQIARIAVLYWVVS